MPRANRVKCTGCEKLINDGAVYGCTNGLFRLFLSARSLKKVEVSDPACRKCRWKFDNWLKKSKGDFDHIIDRDVFDNVIVRISSLNLCCLR